MYYTDMCSCGLMQCTIQTCAPVSVNARQWITCTMSDGTVMLNFLTVGDISLFSTFVFKNIKAIHIEAHQVTVQED
jgi:hypothetical protein